MIEMSHISKTFRVSKRQSGARAAVKSFLKREYTQVHALQDICFRIDEGEIVGYIGPNGAGKSTSIKVMCGILKPDGGECVVNGQTPWRNRMEYVRDIGVVFGQRSQLIWDLPAMDTFVFLKSLYRLKDAEYRQTLELLLETLDIGDVAKTPVRQLSLGQRMKCELAASLLHNPRILFLDEPTIGLDAVSKIKVRQFIQEINALRKVTVILTTHDMHDIEALTNRIILIGKGKILYDGQLDEIRKTYSQNPDVLSNIEEVIAQMYKELEI